MQLAYIIFFLFLLCTVLPECRFRRSFSCSTYLIHSNRFVCSVCISFGLHIHSWISTRILWQDNSTVFLFSADWNCKFFFLKRHLSMPSIQRNFTFIVHKCHCIAGTAANSTEIRVRSSAPLYNIPKDCHGY